MRISSQGASDNASHKSCWSAFSHYQNVRDNVSFQLFQRGATDVWFSQIRNDSLEMSLISGLGNESNLPESSKELFSWSFSQVLVHISLCYNVFTRENIVHVSLKINKLESVADRERQHHVCLSKFVQNDLPYQSVVDGVIFESIQRCLKTYRASCHAFATCTKH